jgi:hypothetical protein
MKHIPMANRANLCSFHGYDIQRSTIQRKNLKLIGFAATIDVHDDTDVPRYQMMLWNICREHDLLMFVHHWFIPSNG